VTAFIGLKNKTGPKGEQGEKGPKGDRGAKGEKGEQGPAGFNGIGVPGVPGVGVPTGGIAGQVLAKIDGSDYNTDWVDQSGGGGIPGGSDTEIQFNDGGSFGAISNFVIDKVTEEFKATGLCDPITIGNPTGTLTITDTGTGFSNPYYGDYVTHYFAIYAYKKFTSTEQIVYSSTPLLGDIYLETGENYRSLQFSFSAVSGATGYILVWSENAAVGSGADYYKDIGNNTTYNDTGVLNFVFAGVYAATPTGSADLCDAPIHLWPDENLSSENFHLLKFGSGEHLIRWNAINQRLTFSTIANSLLTLRANISSPSVLADAATVTNLSSTTFTTGTVEAAVNLKVGAVSASFFTPIAMISSIANPVLKYTTAITIQPTRKTVSINSAGAELGQGVSGTMLSITSESSYAALAMKASGAAGVHFFQIIDPSSVVRSVFRADGNAIFGSINYSNYGRGTFIDDGHSGTPQSGELSTTCYYVQDDENVYGFSVNNATFDSSKRSSVLVGQVLNSGAAWLGTVASNMLQLRTNNTIRMQIDATGGVRVGSSTATPIVNVFSATATLDFPSISSNSTEVLTITVTGAAVGDVVHLGPPSTIEAGLTWSGFVSATNTVTIRLHNTSGGAVNPASATWRAAVTRF
jgi:hypothetical protein